VSAGPAAEPIAPVAPAPDVDVVIVAHNPGALLDAAVRTAAEQVGEARVWVMDAESTDGSTEMVRAARPDVHVVPVPNHGFSASNNRGIEATSGEYVLLLNPDAELVPGAVEALVSAQRATAASGPRAGIVGPLVLNADGSAQANSYGRFPTLLNQVGLRFWRVTQRLLGNGALSPAVPAHAVSVDWVTGACMLVPREAIAQAGAMDEGFFLYYEDVEWCHRMHDGGWDVLLEPAARVVHHLGQAGAPQGRVAQAYRDSFYRYCELYHLWGLAGLAKAGLAVRRVLGGRA